MTAEQTIQTLAADVYKAFTRDSRNDGTEFYRLVDGSPPWMVELCWHAHGDNMPDDFRYEFIHDALNIIEEEGEDNYSSRIDSDTDIYNSDLAKWLTSRLSRSEYVDDGVEEYGWPEDRGIYGALAIGQYKEREEVLYLVRDFLQGRLEGEEEADAE